MKSLLVLTFVSLAAAILSAEDRDRSTPVIVELFTSQGCSSCPPADRLLTRLGEEGLPGNVEVIPLSFHVDYWNYIGWTDPFSSKEWSDRQRGYIRALGENTLYTPALVIQGSSQVVGADTREVLGEIARVLRDPSSTAVAIDLELEARDQEVDVAIETRVDAPIPGHGLDLLIAIYEKELVTRVASGENARRELRNDYVVRHLSRGPAIDRSGETRSASLSIPLDQGWRRHRLGVAAFAQDPATLKIYGAGSADLGR